jgi:D-alanyl-lipoteichoic acid acyltransferase DltB (MBOAT superfamily)
MEAALPGITAGKAVQPSAGNGRIGVSGFIVILAQLGLLTLVFRQFQVESSAFLRLWLLAFAGFAVHSFLPLRYRLPFFLALSLAGIALVLGVESGAWLVGIGLVLIGICHLPLPFVARIGLVLALASVLAAQRAQWLPAPWSEAVWPILGSMFMFRLIVYLYDLRHEREAASPVRTLSYFFMLPNACFPLFPVVDYKTFRRNYYDDDAYRIYQIGVDWMVRGVLHLILYRIVYYYFTLAPSEVQGLGDLAQYLVSNFLLYLRVSGTFHLIVGMLYLFGFRLPETHHRYLLSSSISDFWRRINIYWKDFMLKVFYYPAYFALRRFGNTWALVLATLLVFVMTWFLHAYQWFWLRGTMLLVWQDVLFWAILGVLVVFNSLWESRKGRQRTLRKKAWDWRDLSLLGLKIAAMFSFICVLWSFWTSESISQWMSLWTILAGQVARDVGAAPVVLAGAMLVGAVAGGAGGKPGANGETPRSRWRGLAASFISLAMLLALGIEGIYTHFGPAIASFIQPLRSGKLSRLDTATLERGYYENLLQVNRFNTQLWEVYYKRPANWLDTELGALKRHVGGFAQTELLPSLVISSRYGSISTNRWGMRDKDYELRPAAGSYRIALLGPSTVMGWGVADGQTFEALLESRLNAQAAGGSRQYEILNFGVPGYDPPQQLHALARALEFAPHAVFYVATGREPSRAARYLVEVVGKGIDIPYSTMNDVVTKAGLQPGTEETAALRRIAPFHGEILAAVYQGIVERCRERGVTPILIFLPQVREGQWQEETAETLRIAREAGFFIVDLADIYKGADVASIRLAEWDDHPNARGHELVASRLYAELAAKAPVGFLARQPAASGELKTAK